MNKIISLKLTLLGVAICAISSCTFDSSSVSIDSSLLESYQSYIASIQDNSWNLDFAQYGSSFRNTLASLINQKGSRQTTYYDCRLIGAKAAAYPSIGSSKFVPFYHTTSTLVNISSVESEINREHCWPNSRGGGYIETDPFVIRPTLTSDNSARQNYFYGIGDMMWDPKSCGFEGARGESARIILYAATRYANLGLSLSNNQYDATNQKTMGKLSTLLEWNAQYPVTDIEMQINNYLCDQGYGRNPFVDHPEYASFIWSSNGLRTSPITDGELSSYSQSTIEYTHSKQSNIDQLDGHSFAIVAPSYRAVLTNTCIKSTLPWYLTKSSINLNADLSQGYFDIDTSSVMFKFSKQSNGTYTIYNEDKNVYLMNYISGTHYSITYSTTVEHDTELSKYWNLTSSNGGFIFAGTTGVYLTYNTSRSNFSGASSSSSPLYLFG